MNPVTPEMRITKDDGSKVKFAGVPIFMNGETFIVPPLSVRQLRAHEEKMRSFGSLSDDTVIKRLPEILEIIADAIGRNYPTITASNLEDMLDTSTIGQVMRAVVQASGFRVARVGEAGPVAESTGAGSSVQ